MQDCRLGARPVFKHWPLQIISRQGPKAPNENSATPTCRLTLRVTAQQSRLWKHWPRMGRRSGFQPLPGTPEIPSSSPASPQKGMDHVASLMHVSNGARREATADNMEMDNCPPTALCLKKYHPRGYRDSSAAKSTGCAIMRTQTHSTHKSHPESQTRLQP